MLQVLCRSEPIITETIEMFASKLELPPSSMAQNIFHLTVNGGCPYPGMWKQGVVVFHTLSSQMIPVAWLPSLEDLIVIS